MWSFWRRTLPARRWSPALDVDENPATSERFGVMGLPTLLVLRQGQEIDRIVGVAPYEEIKERIARLLGNV
jgi:thioredoxin 1